MPNLTPFVDFSTLSAVLFDLDDTLLGNNMERFVPRYFQLLYNSMQDTPGGLAVIGQLWAATEHAMRTADPARTVQDVLWQALEELSGVRSDVAAPWFDAFYVEQFPLLYAATQPRLIARPLIERCLARGWQVVIATNPVFPRRAVEERLRWAGVPVTELPYALVTTYEIMHATKPHPAYYREILQRIGQEAAACLMVGDDWENDIAPAQALGLATYWTPPGGCPPDAAAPCGTLAALYAALGD